MKVETKDPRHDFHSYFIKKNGSLKSFLENFVRILEKPYCFDNINHDILYDQKRRGRFGFG
jgi:hypothetical protein